MILDDDLERWEQEFDRRSIVRTRIAKGASLFFSHQSGVHACFVRDVTNVGAGIRVPNLPVLPLGFELSFDNFHTVRLKVARPLAGRDPIQSLLLVSAANAKTISRKPLAAISGR